jgi:hypothetical protein
MPAYTNTDVLQIADQVYVNQYGKEIDGVRLSNILRKCWRVNGDPVNLLTSTEVDETVRTNSSKYRRIK